MSKHAVEYAKELLQRRDREYTVCLKRSAVNQPTKQGSNHEKKTSEREEIGAEGRLN